ncbi:MAG: phenylacetate--CoA ligase family protein [Bacteroidetes bacterium]|nr:phenylacetate--CoA ligase family protein [Bacteroidota bacterium]
MKKTDFNSLLSYDLDSRLNRINTDKLEQHILDLFYKTALTVPAYKKFLAENNVGVSSIQTLEDFQKIPFVTKENYIKKYPIAETCRYGDMANLDFISVSSGSTGVPTFWMRDAEDEINISERFEQVLTECFVPQAKSNLCVICFPLGTWVGGLFTTNCVRFLSMKGYRVTIIAPGNNKDEILRVVSELGKKFERVILFGYPPFLKDVVDTGISKGMDWKQFDNKLVMAGEVISEEWRTLMSERLGIKDELTSFSSLYGTADAGVLANETPLTIKIRKFFSKHPELTKRVFGQSRLSSLCQYDPYSRYFEQHENTLLFTGDNGIPLIRYHINDDGGIYSFDEMISILNENGFDVLAEMEKDYPDLKIRNMPFVYVFGRSMFTLSYFGANIYPENISIGLQSNEVKDIVTGKYVMQILEDEDKNMRFRITVELVQELEPDEEKRELIGRSILASILHINSEYKNYVPAEYQVPFIVLKKAGDKEYFPVGVKHRYVR